MTAVINALDPAGNGAEPVIALSEPYQVSVRLKGVCPLLFHRWSNEAVASKSAAAKNSAAKKQDNVESYVWRLPDNNHIGLPGEYVRMACVMAAKFRQDPRSPRKSAYDLYRAAVISLTELADLGVASWDYLDRRRVMVQRNGVTRERPAMSAGWEASLTFQVQLPEYVPPSDFLDVLTNAGRLIGIGDFRPSYGRFQVVGFSTH